MKTIFFLIRREMLSEWRQKFALNGIFLYVVATVFVCYLSFNMKQKQLNPIVWNALFWIIMLFSAVNAVAKSFMQENEGRFMYFYTLVSPVEMILSKIIYNTGLMLILAFTAFGFYAFVMGNPIQDVLLFVINLFLGALGFSSSLTLLSGIAAKSNNNATLMAVLSFPVILPMLLMLIKVSKNAIDGLAWSVSYDEMLTLGALNVIVVMVSVILFPYLWKS